MAKHFDDNGNEIRCVYLAEFEADGYCYVGTTSDYDKRVSDHLFDDRRSEVFQHKRHTGFVPRFTMLHNYTSIEEADRLEYFYTIEYAKLRRKILNVQKPGGYGHKATYPKSIKGKINVNATPYNAKAEYENNTVYSYKYHQKGEYSDSVKRVYDILVMLCKRVCEEGGERIYIRKKDIPYTFDDDELYSYNNISPKKSTCTLSLCDMSFCNYRGEKANMSYIVCSAINEKIVDFDVLCQYDVPGQIEKSCIEIYHKCYVFKRTEAIKEYIHNNIEDINNEISRYFLEREITAPFRIEVGIEEFGYREDMECSQTDYAVMLSLLGDMFSPSFEIDFDKDWNLSFFALSVSYNSYSSWAKRYNSYEMQDYEKQSKFRKLVEKIDNYIYTEKDKIQEYPVRIEILSKDLGITDIEILKSFMRHFYVSHGTSWDIGSMDSCICSIENYNGNNMNGCKFIIDIQGEQLFLFYDLRNHILDDSNSYFNTGKRDFS